LAEVKRKKLTRSKVLDKFTYISLKQQPKEVILKIFTGGHRLKAQSEIIGTKLNSEDAKKTYFLFISNKPIPRALKPYVEAAETTYKAQSAYTRFAPTNTEVQVGQVFKETYNVGETQRRLQYDVSHHQTPASKGGDAIGSPLEQSKYNMARGNRPMTSKERSAIGYHNMQKAENKFFEAYGDKNYRDLKREFIKHDRKPATVKTQPEQLPREKPVNLENCTITEFEALLTKAVNKANKAGLTTMVITGVIGLVYNIVINIPRYYRGEITQAEFAYIVSRNTTRMMLKTGAVAWGIAFICAICPPLEAMLVGSSIILFAKEVPKLLKGIREIVFDYENTYFCVGNNYDNYQVIESYKEVTINENEAFEAYERYLKIKSTPIKPDFSKSQAALDDLLDTFFERK
jgi:hypothetical protein